jgi:hypothetical protein
MIADELVWCCLLYCCLFVLALLYVECFYAQALAMLFNRIDRDVAFGMQIAAD